MKRWEFFLPLFALLTACATAPRPAAQFTGKPEAPEAGLSIRLYPEKDGVSVARLTGAPLQSSIVLGEARAEGDGWRIALTRLNWFNNWANGWTEASFLLDGIVSLQPGPAGWMLKVEKVPELDMVGSASIRYFDTFIRDEKGLAEFSRRWNRIQAVATDLKSRFPGAASFRDPKKLRRYLFPEIYGYDSPPASGHAMASALGVVWNSDYTKASFSEPLRILRDSGTLLRDYKESPGLWPLALEWKDFWERGDESLAFEKK